MKIEKPLLALLRKPVIALIARLLLTLPFWTNGLARLVNFEAGIAEMEAFGLPYGAPINGLVILSNLLGAGLVIARRWTWLGAGVLAGFTLATIVVVHRFWAFEGVAATRSLHVAFEHIGIIGGLLLATILDTGDRERDHG